MLTPDVSRLAPTPSAPAIDAAPVWVAGGTPEPLRSELIGALGEDRVLTRALDLIAYASDASPYRLIPQAVVMSHDVEDIRRLLALARRLSTPLVFRAGGTSLNGQAQTDSILVDVTPSLAADPDHRPGRARAGPAGSRARSRQPVARPPRPQARP